MACPICVKPTVPEHRPFCSKRCADVDLARWFSGAYAVPIESPDEEAPAEEDERPDRSGEASEG